ncbi:MAG: glycolate oxidase subunit GlcE [Aquabacterium sp.]|nr:MAG: glycolate oxidase subunit GlcE [Aquabacterium sp.]
MSLQLLIDQVRDAAGRNQPLCIRGAGSKEFLGGPLRGETLSTSATPGLHGIVAYEPSELYLTARAATSVAEIEHALSRRGQHLAFEPPRFGFVPGAEAAVSDSGVHVSGTVGGMVAAGLSGPARATAGAVRDHVLGATLLNGRGEVLRFGGQVMKNVAGFDVSRLLAGSMGTLGVILDVTLKVLPVAPAEATLRFDCPEDQAITQINHWAGKPVPIDASAWWDGTMVLRLRGAQAAVNAALQTLGGERIPEPTAGDFWRGLRDHDDEFFNKARAAVAAAGNQGVGLWRLSVPPTAPPLGLPGEQLIEWHGALRWICTPVAPHLVRQRAAEVGGHATLFVGHPAQRRLDLVCPPLSAPLLRIHRHLKQSFDPAGIFNRGRWYDDGYADAPAACVTTPA